MTQAYNLALLANAVDTSGRLNVGTNATGTLPVANGGTGTSSPSLVAGTGITISGSFPNQTIASSGGGGTLQMQLFTTSGSWTAPTGVTRVYAEVVAGGGGGSGYFLFATRGWAGYGAGFYTVVPGTTYTITVGAGGAGTNTDNTQGAAGGTSSFGSFLSATAGGPVTGPDGCGNYSTGASGTATGSTIFSTNISNSYGVNFAKGDIFRRTGNTAAGSFSPSVNVCAGASGSSETGSTTNNSSGGCAGAVFLQWVGS